MGLRLYVTFLMQTFRLCLGTATSCCLQMSLVESFGLWRCREEAAMLAPSEFRDRRAVRVTWSHSTLPVCLPSGLLLLVGLTVPHAQFHTTPEAIWPFFPGPPPPADQCFWERCVAWWLTVCKPAKEAACSGSRGIHQAQLCVTFPSDLG